MNDTRSNHRWILAFGLTIAVAVQLTVISGTWYLDSDDWFIIDMGRQVVTAPALDQFTRFWSEEPTWRPLLTARTAVEYALFGDLAAPRIIVNLILHLMCALLLFGAVRTWFGRPEAAAWTAVLFAVHPLHAEALTWFHSGFEGITPTLFVLLTVWLFVSRRPLALGLLAFQLAILTRENSLFLPLLLGAAAAVRAPKSDRLMRAFTDASPYVALLVANVALRLVMIYFAGGESTSDFHVVENPLAAILTTALHPWIPIHPALPLRLTWWVTFAAVPLILIWVQWGMDRRELKTAFVAFFIATLPFLPVFHA
ncbi:MAG: hypothetical protein ACI9OJ_003278, partial [Myxococcota bacterium]